MKFMTFVTFDVAKVAEIAAVADKTMSNLPKGYKILGNYACMSPPFPVPPNTIVSVTITDFESAEAMAAVSYPLMLAGATISRVPLMDSPVGAAVKTEEKLRD